MMAEDGEKTPEVLSVDNVPVLLEDDKTEADHDLGTDSNSNNPDSLTMNGENDVGSVAEGTEYELCMEEEGRQQASGIGKNDAYSCTGSNETVDESCEVQKVDTESDHQGSEPIPELEPEAEQDGKYLGAGVSYTDEHTESCESLNDPSVEEQRHNVSAEGLANEGADFKEKLEKGEVNLGVQQASSFETEQQQDCVKTGSSPTLSLAEEDQTETTIEVCYPKDSEDYSESDGVVNQSDLDALPNNDLEEEEVEDVDKSNSSQGLEVQGLEPDDPECDLASSDSVSNIQVTSDPPPNPAVIPQNITDSPVNNTPSSSNDSSPNLNTNRQSSGTSQVKEALGLMLKQGIRSAAKDASPIREVLGHLHQGFKSALSETATFLEGNSGTMRYEHLSPQPLSPSVPSPSRVAQVRSIPSPEAEALGMNREKGGDGAGDASTLSDVPEDDLLSQLDAELDDEQTNQVHGPQVNGVRRFDLNEIPEFKELKLRYEEVQKALQQQKDQCIRLRSVNEAQDDILIKTQREAGQYKRKLESFNDKSTEEVFMAQIRAMETTIASQQKEISEYKELMELHDTAGQEAVAKIQNDMKSKLDQIQALADSRQKDKEDMVLKYAKAESKNIEMENKMAKNDAKMRDMLKERDAFVLKFKTLKADQTKCRELFEARSTEVLHLRRELDKCKELLVSQEGKTKWAHNKLKAEMDLHKETKAKLEEAIRKKKSTMDEAEQIRRDCQSMIKCYQESEEIKSNSLDIELKHKESELILHRQDKIDKEEVHSLLRRELETLKMKHKEMLEELTTWRDKVKCLDSERIIQEQNLDKYRETLQKQKETHADLEKRLSQLEDIEVTVIDTRKEIANIQSRNRELEQECAELKSDMDKCSTREQEHLEFTQKISDKNAHLQSENSALQNKVKGYSAEVERLTELSDDLHTKCQKREKELNALKKVKQTTDESMSSQLQEKVKEVEKLTTEVDDMKNEIKTLKRKHAANTKDLMRQLQNSKRRLESLEPKDAVSMGSRTSSNGSLDTVNNANQHLRSGTSSTPAVDPEPEPFVQVVEVDKQMLIEKIVRLQKAHARKNEKLEFLEDHIQQLFTEVQKKNKIIQSYALREEAGTIAPEATDLNKALLAKKSGIMSSLYNAQQQDGAMTLDLSLDISRKLQAVLEDTILKNITLKDNLDTLGEEIARLSQENRKMKLKDSNVA